MRSSILKAGFFLLLSVFLHCGLVGQDQSAETQLAGNSCRVRSHQNLPADYFQKETLPSFTSPDAGWTTIRFVEHFPLTTEFDPDTTQALWLRCLPDSLVWAKIVSEKIGVLNAGEVGDVTYLYINGQKHFSLGKLKPYQSAFHRRLLYTFAAPKDPPVIDIVVFGKEFPASFFEVPVLSANSLGQTAHFWRQTVSITLLLIYILVGSFHLLLFSRRPEHKFQLYFGLFCLALAVMSALQMDIKDIFFSESILWRIKIEHAALAYLPVLMILFLDSFLFQEDKSKIARGTLVLATLFSGFTLLSPGFEQVRLFLEGYIIIAAMLIGYFIYRIIQAVLYDIYNAYFLLVGVIVLALTGLNDIFIEMGLIQSYFGMAKFGFLGFLLCNSVLVALQFLQLQTVSTQASMDLEKQNKKLESAYLSLQHSQELYKQLIENLTDIVFITDPKGGLSSINKAIEVQLGIPTPAEGVNLLDVFFTEAVDEHSHYQYEREYFYHHFEQCTEYSARQRFLVQFRFGQTGEPKLFEVLLDMIEVEGEPMVFGKAASQSADALRRYFRKEEASYSLHNHLILADIMSQRIVANCSRYLKNIRQRQLRTVIRELLINAIEHGNLDISFADKTEAIAQEQYFKLINIRQRDPKLRNRRVSVYYRVNKRYILVKISDEGDGFDHKPGASMATANKNLLAHGRGREMARQFFDHMAYNRKGNAVICVKYFKRR